MKKIYLGFINYASASESALKASAWLDAAETKKLHSISRESSRKSFLAGRTLIRSALATLNDTTPAAIQLNVLEGGKPVCGSHIGYHFSLSHSGGLAAIAVSQAPIGLDLEAFHADREVIAIAKTVFGLAEQKALFDSAGSSEQRGTAALGTTRLFHAMWTLKEAWLKLRGLGLNELSLCPDFIPLEPGLIRIQGDQPSHSCRSWTWELQDATGKDFILSVATEGAGAEAVEVPASSTVVGVASNVPTRKPAAPSIHILPDFTGGVPALVLRFESEPARKSVVPAGKKS